MSEYIYDLPMTDWALNFAYKTDIENELDSHQITMSNLRRQFDVNGKIVAYRVSTSSLSRRYLTLHVELNWRNEKKPRLVHIRLYSPFAPQKLKNLQELIGLKIKSISPLCTIRHRRIDGPIIIASSIRIEFDNSIIIMRTSLEDDESPIMSSSQPAGGMLTTYHESLLKIDEKDLLTVWYRDETGFNAVLDPCIAKKLGINIKE